jgi:hypothetical protein
MSDQEPDLLREVTSLLREIRDDLRNQRRAAAEPPPTRTSAEAPPPELLTKALIRRYYFPVGERTLDRWISSGWFPKPDIVFGGKVRYWRRGTVESFIVQLGGGGRLKGSAMNA